MKEDVGAAALTSLGILADRMQTTLHPPTIKHAAASSPPNLRAMAYEGANEPMFQPPMSYLPPQRPALPVSHAAHSSFARPSLASAAPQTAQSGPIPPPTIGAAPGAPGLAGTSSQPQLQSVTNSTPMPVLTPMLPQAPPQHDSTTHHNETQTSSPAVPHPNFAHHRPPIAFASRMATPQMPAPHRWAGTGGPGPGGGGGGGPPGAPGSGPPPGIGAAPGGAPPLGLPTVPPTQRQFMPQWLGDDTLDAEAGNTIDSLGGAASALDYEMRRNRLSRVRPRQSTLTENEKRARHNAHTRSSRLRIDRGLQKLKDALKKAKPELKLNKKADIVDAAVNYVHETLATMGGGVHQHSPPSLAHDGHDSSMSA